MTVESETTSGPHQRISQDIKTSIDKCSSTAICPRKSMSPSNPASQYQSLPQPPLPSLQQEPSTVAPVLPSEIVLPTSSLQSPPPSWVTDKQLLSEASSSSRMSTLCVPHPSWSKPASGFVDDNIEDMGSYATGGFHPVRLGDIFNQRYTVVHKLGNGGFAVVWLAWDKRDARWVSLKIVRAHLTDTCKDLDFLRYLAQLDIDLEANFICPLLDDFKIQGPNGNHVCMVFPFAGSSVFEEIDDDLPATQEERADMARQYSRQLLHAVAVLHSVGIGHGDITVANVLTQVNFRQSSLDELYGYIGTPERVVDRRWSTNPGCDYLVSPARLSSLPSNGRILLIDFGESFWIGHPPVGGLGIPIISATPEGLYSGSAGPSSDIWAIACLLFRWWSGQYLFQGRNRNEMSWDWVVVLGKLPLAHWTKYTDRHKDFDESGRLLKQREDLHDINLAKVILDAWMDISTYLQDDIEPGERACVKILTRSLVDLPSMSTSLKGSLNGKRCVITLNQIAPSTRDPTCPVSRPDPPADPADSKLPANLLRLAGLHCCVSDKARIQLPPAVAAFHCLLERLLAYDPAQRPPALVILQHHWVRGESCQCAVPEEVRACESAGTLSEDFTTTNSARSFSMTASQHKLGGPTSAKSQQTVSTSAESCLQSAIVDDVLISPTTEGQKTQKWSAVFDMHSRTWEYERCFD